MAGERERDQNSFRKYNEQKEMHCVVFVCACAQLHCCSGLSERRFTYALRISHPMHALTVHVFICISVLFTIRILISYITAFQQHRTIFLVHT